MPLLCFRLAVVLEFHILLASLPPATTDSHAMSFIVSYPKRRKLQEPSAIRKDPPPAEEPDQDSKPEAAAATADSTRSANAVLAHSGLFGPNCGAYSPRW